MLIVGASSLWVHTVTSGGCVMCKHEPPAGHARDAARLLWRVEGHHIISKQHLRRYCKADFERLRWDARNGLGLCQWHHMRHESCKQRVPRELLPAGAIEFAAELGLDWLLEREYPQEEIHEQ